MTHVSDRWAAPLIAAAVAPLVPHLLPAVCARGPVRRLRPALSGQGRSGGIALTFDGGPDPLGTPQVLDLLGELGWTATFFMLGSQVQRSPMIARAVAAAGHEVAVQGHTHLSHLLRTGGDVRSDLARACDEIAHATGAYPRWFRPPCGALTRGSVTAARENGLTPVLWTSSGSEWRAPRPGRLLATVLADLADGGTVRLWDSDGAGRPGRSESTVGALRLLAYDVGRRDLSVRALSEHLPASPASAAQVRTARTSPPARWRTQPTNS